MDLMPIYRVGRMMLHCPKCAGAFATTAGLAWVALVLIASTALGQASITADGDWLRRRARRRRRFPVAEGEATAQGTDHPTSPADLPQPALPPAERRRAAPPPDDVLLKDSLFEKWGQDIEHWKSQWPVSVTFGAYNWWHVNNGGPIPSGYGIPGVPGTHSYYLFGDKEEPVDWGEISKIGARADALSRQRRARCVRSIPTPTSGSGRPTALSTRRWDV